MVRRGGPTPRINKALVERIIALIRIGNYIEVAAQANQVSKQTLYKWFKLGGIDKKAGKNTLYVLLIDSVHEAVAQSEARDVTSIDKHAIGRKAIYDDKGKILQDEIKSDWKASAWRLIRRAPKRWGNVTQSVELSGPEGGPIRIEEKRSALHKVIADENARELIIKSLIAKEEEEEKDKDD